MGIFKILGNAVVATAEAAVSVTGAVVEAAVDVVEDIID